MPHLTSEHRERVHKQGWAWTGAELNYLISYHINRFLSERATTRQLRYADFEEALGALAGAKREFERNVIDPYEARKASENGNVFGTARLLANGSFVPEPLTPPKTET